MNRRELGCWGEKKAIKFLKEKEYKILKKNFYTSLGEIDIIASKREWIIFVEVKTRFTQNFGAPAEAVDYSKQKKIKKIAQIFLKKKNIFHMNLRFDVISIKVVSGKVCLEHFPHAFY